MMMEAALGVDAAPLLAMQNEYDMLMAERKIRLCRNSSRFAALRLFSNKLSF